MKNEPACVGSFFVVDRSASPSRSAALADEKRGFGGARISAEACFEHIRVEKDRVRYPSLSGNTSQQTMDCDILFMSYIIKYAKALAYSYFSLYLSHLPYLLLHTP
jgi:hypothetical protein